MKIEFSGPAFGENLRALRQKYGLSKRSLGKLVGIAPATVDALEKGTCRPVVSARTLRRLCQVFDVTAECFCNTDC